MGGAFHIDLARIRPDPAQPRREFDEAELENLVASVRERGIRSPIRVWFVAEANVYQIIAGERRFRAATAAGLTAVPCLIEPVPASATVLDRKAILIEQIVENWQRADLKPVELSEALKELRDVVGLTQEEIARLTGKNKSEVSRLIGLQERTLPEILGEAKSDSSGRFSRRALIAISTLPAGDQRNLADKVKREKLSAVDVEKEARRMKSARHGVYPRGAPTTVRKFAVGSTRVQLTFRKRSVTAGEVMEVLDRVKAMVECDGGTTESNGPK